MITVSRLARQFALSRSTLLYYDRIGLLRPSGRSRSNYRLYSRADRERLEGICRYREMGLPLNAIRNLLDMPQNGPGAALEKRLGEIDRQIQGLHLQRSLIRRLLGHPSLQDAAEGMTRRKWTALLRASGLTDAGMLRWHREFERLFPEDHQSFLESLRIPPDEIRAIRAVATASGRGGSGVADPANPS